MDSAPYEGDTEFMRAIHAALCGALKTHMDPRTQVEAPSLPWGGLREVAFYDGGADGARIVFRTWAGRDFEVRRLWEDGPRPNERRSEP